jgi:FAD/FMN-containing dehydrogenase
VTLPASQVLAYRKACQAVLDQHGLRPIELGLWCTPELFSVAMAPATLGQRQGRANMAKAVDEMLTVAQEMGGSMEYCHGVGLRLAHLMPREHGLGLEVMRALKGALDPQGILNPGKLGL